MKNRHGMYFADIGRVMTRGRTPVKERSHARAGGGGPKGGEQNGDKRKLKTPADDDDELRTLEIDVKEFEDKDEEDPGPGEIRLVSEDDYLKGVSELSDEAKRSHKRRELHGDRLVKLAGCMQRLHKGYLRQKQEIEQLAKRPRFQGGREGLDFSSVGTRMRVPKRFAKNPASRLYYLMTTRDPQEVGAAAMFDGVSAAEMTPQMRAFARKRLLNETSQAHWYEVQALNDLAVIGDAIIAQTDPDYGAQPRHIRMRGLRVVREFNRAFREMRDAAMDTVTAGEGLEWVIPTMLSTQLHTIIQAQLVLADQFEWPNMPGPSWKDPVEGADPIAYVTNQATEDPADAAAKAPASVVETRAFQLDAITARARVVLSDESEEDLVIPAIPRIMFQVARAHARFREIALVNGFKNALAGFDTADVPPARDARTAWNGLRWFQKNVQAGLTGGDTLEVDFANAAPTASLLAQMLGVGKEYAHFPDESFYLTGYSGFIRLLVLTDNGNAIVLTVDKMGPNATILRGQLGQLFARPVVVSQYVREDLNASGIYDNVTKTRTIYLHVNRRCFKGGMRRQLRMQRGDELKMETGQIVVASSERLAWSPVNFAGRQGYVTLGKNVPSY